MKTKFTKILVQKGISSIFLISYKFLFEKKKKKIIVKYFQKKKIRKFEENFRVKNFFGKIFDKNMRI